MRPSWKCLLIGVVVAVALSSVAPQADAQWWGGYYRTAAYGCCYTPSYSCYTPCYTTVSCYSPCYDSCGWYLGCRPGPIRRALFGPYRWYYGGYRGSGCSTYDVCCSTVDSCCTDGTVAPGAPTQAPTPAKKPVAEPAMPEEPAATPAPPEPELKPVPQSGATPAAESGFLTIWVPYDAKVTVNGMETKSTGSRRQFVSFGLKPGFSYKYEVKAQVIRDGQVQEDTKTVMLTAGEVSAVAFGFNVPSQQVASAQ